MRAPRSAAAHRVSKCAPVRVTVAEREREVDCILARIRRMRLRISFSRIKTPPTRRERDLQGDALLRFLHR